MSAPNHDFDDDIVKNNPVAGKGNKKPPPIPKRPNFTPLQASTAKSSPNLPSYLDRSSPIALFTHILPKEEIDNMCKATNTFAREAFAKV